MKTFNDLVVVKQALDPLWEVMRDRLPELAEHLDDIDHIACLKRELHGDHCLRLCNQWFSVHKIPSILHAMLGDEPISWLDTNEWDNSEHICRWAIEPSVLRDHIRCSGQTRYTPAMGGRGTRIQFTGEFAILPGVLNTFSGALEKPFLAFIESMVTTLIPKNLRRTIEVAGQFIQKEASAEIG